MSSRLPVEINPFRLVEQRRSLVGSLALSRLPRLQDMLCSSDSGGYVGGVKVQMDFDRTETGLPHVSGEIEAQFDLTCQRCLNQLTHSVTIPLNVILVKTDAQAERAPEGFDTYLVEDDRLFMQDFIEDEILLALPISAMHEEHEECEPAKPYIEALPEDEVYLGGNLDKSLDKNLDNSPVNGLTNNSVEKDVHDNPFAALKKLKDLE